MRFEVWGLGIEDGGLRFGVWYVGFEETVTRAPELLWIALIVAPAFRCLGLRTSGLGFRV